ncbi:ATP-binding protein [Catenovulum sp. 2E275]|uniref:sensor histidine kinase n=1 Tax=Catenovulum sp. 2E275 TaxID=2980497 RepID=UPI0021CF1809|nr:ATP-binding protein [Catenovulum sp. 2E275]MCU4675147.1 ATP-binding protein [Catenovulum sp. 2E275]
MKTFVYVMNSQLSIKSQATAIVVTGIILMMVILSIVTTKAVNQQSRQLMLKNAYQITQGLANQSIYPILSGSKENAQSAMEQVLGFQSVLAARIILGDGQSNFIFGGSFDFPIQAAVSNLENAQITFETNQFWLISSPVFLNTNNGEENESQIDYLNATHQEEIIGYAQVIYSKQNLVEAQNRITFTISLIGIVSGAALSVLLYIALVRLFSPLDRLAKAMAHAQKTSEHTYADETGAKEVRNMAHSYNNMMRVLAEHEEQLRSHKDILEKEVELRTRELTQARDSALTASRHKTEFMANMSHELRTPIQSILGYGELINESLMLDENFELLDDMDKITKNAERLLAMINSLLDLAKIEAGKLDLQLIELNIDRIVADIKDVIPPLAAKNKNRLVINSQVKNFKFFADKDKLEQVLINLLSNACKFTENGEVSLVISKSAQYLIFKITDTGIGLSEEQQSYIFEEFRQVDGGQNRKFSGTGLGLAISKKFVELMGGQIQLKSKLGEGSCFSVILPF